MKSRAVLVVALLSLASGAFAAGDAKDGERKSAPCQSCHGADGNGTGPQFPRLAGQYPDYLVQALTDYQKGNRKNPIMMPFAASLSPQDMEDLAAFYSTRPNGLYKRP
jgi:cytochrome c553